MTYQTLLKYGLQWVVAISLGAVTAVSSAAEQGQGVKGVQIGTLAVSRSAIIYRPLLHDVSLAKVGGSTQGIGGEITNLLVLVPDHAGLTTQAQPALYWYARTPMVAQYKFTLTRKGGTDPLLEVETGSEKVAGIQRLDLGDHNISLEPEVAYQWSVVLVMSEGSRTVSVTSSGIIERMELGEGLTSRIKNSHGTDLVAVYASEGFWYDALETISSMIDESPEDQGLVAIRKSLLEQVGLYAAAGN